MDSRSDDSWSTLESCSFDSDSELECSTCSSSNDEDCSYKREASLSRSQGTNTAAAVKKPEFGRRLSFVLKEKVENDLEEDFGECGDEDEEHTCDSDSGSSSSWSSGSDEEEEEGQAGHWAAVDTRRRFPFTAAPSMRTGSAQTPLDYFYLLFSQDLVQFLADTINDRGRELAADKKKAYRPTDAEEVYTLLCTHFMLGFVTCIADEILYERRPSLNVDFNSYMRKDRFRLLFRLLTYRAARNRSRKDYRSWYDVAQPVADRFNAVMKYLMVPGKNLNIEKETVLYFNEKNIVLSKPERIRLHLLADDNGIFQRVFLVDPELQKEVRGETIVLKLMEDFLDCGRSLYTSHMLYPSVPLAEYYLKRQTYLTGILKKNRARNPTFLKMKPESTKLPVRLFKKELPDDKKGDKNAKVSNKEIRIVHGFNEHGVCVVRVMRRHVKFNMLSTEFDAAPAVDNRWDCQITEEVVKHTDMAKRDKQLAKCGPQLQRRDNRHVAYILRALCINAYLMYKVNTGKKIKFINFLEEILYQMLPLEDNKVKENAGRNKKPGEGARRRRVRREVPNCIVN